ncbi:hypothetical protein ACS6O4_26205, partial [Enterobacter hormaechei subsp. steigerwaltii]|uniref:hypothetical protein n=1 Tax=Enterobacter hormaechei TaxID=158836 RepID=UPI003F41EA5E
RCNRAENKFIHYKSCLLIDFDALNIAPDKNIPIHSSIFDYESYFQHPNNSPNQYKQHYLFAQIIR